MLKDTVKTTRINEVMFKAKEVKNTKWVSLLLVGEASWSVAFHIYTGSEMHCRWKDNDLYWMLGWEIYKDYI